MLASHGVRNSEHSLEFARQRRTCRDNIETGSARPVVLFVCGHNAGRSQMAEAWLRVLSGDQVISMSAGSNPSDQINPQAVEAMAERGIDISAHFPKRLCTDVMQATDHAFTMGCGDACANVPGVTKDWPLPDPHGEGLAIVRSIRDDIEDRVRLFLMELNIEVASKNP